MMASEGTGSVVRTDDDERLVVVIDAVSDALVFDWGIQGTTTRSFTASKAAETHKSKRINSELGLRAVASEKLTYV
jgi:hypothetical protein